MSNTFITPERNDNFVSLRGVDLQDLLVETENYLLEYRDKLNLSPQLTFGVELEYEGIMSFTADKFISRNFIGWVSKGDGSLDSGGEIISPILYDKDNCWQELKKVCEFLRRKKADTLHKAAGHIHIGTHILGEDVEVWRTFLKVYTAYESVIFRFIYGDKISRRRKLLYYAPPIADLLYEQMPAINSALSLYDIRRALYVNTKYAAISFRDVDFYNPESIFRNNTLEFRSQNATTSEVVWQNNINAFAKMLVSSRDKVMDEEFLDYKLKHEYVSFSFDEYMYNDVCLKNVLEFVDLIFDNNLDKVYFLRQYLKNFQVNYGIETARKAKKFVK